MDDLRWSGALDLISDALPFGRLWYGGPNAVSNAIGYASHYSRSHDAVIRVYDEAGNVIETHEHAGDVQRGFVNNWLLDLRRRKIAVVIVHHAGGPARCEARASARTTSFGLSRSTT